MGGLGVGAGAGGGGGGEICTSTSAEAKAVPIDLVFLIDRSGTMGLPDSSPKLFAVESALSTFLNDPASDGIGAGIVYFPTVKPADLCAVLSYKVLDVPIAPLPDNAFALTNSMPATWSWGTPEHSGLKGALLAATAYQDAHPTHKVNVVIATDGDGSYGCDGENFVGGTYVQDLDALEELAQEAQDYNGVHTYVVAVPGATIASLDKLAAAGGTTAAYDITQDISKFSAAMAEIRNAVLACDFELPPPPLGMDLLPDKVNFTYTPGGTDKPVILPRADDLADCGDEPGWYYDSNIVPTKILLCPASCTTVKNDTSAKVDVAFGCNSVLN